MKINSGSMSGVIAHSNGNSYQTLGICRDSPAAITGDFFSQFPHSDLISYTALQEHTFLTICAEGCARRLFTHNNICRVSDQKLISLCIGH